MIFVYFEAASPLILLSALVSGALTPEQGRPMMGPSGRATMASPEATLLMFSASASSAACCLLRATWRMIIKIFVVNLHEP